MIRRQHAATTVSCTKIIEGEFHCALDLDLPANALGPASEAPFGPPKFLWHIKIRRPAV